jgi:hypothetical protein
MSRVAIFIIGVLLGAGAMFVSLRYHVVRADDGLHLVPRASSELGMPYVDIREFGVADWNEHRELALDIVRADKGALLQSSTIDSLRQTMEGVMKSLRPSDGADR